MSRWHKEYACVECAGKLTWNQVMGSQGCCPLCGHITEGTVCDALETASEVKVAWTITKLKWVRVLLAPILRLHVWLELKRRGH